jgi:Rod binding domain-containing protein
MSIDFSPLSVNLMPEPSSAGNPKKLAEAAKQFEALMITQMMKSARETSGGGWLSDGDETGEDTSMGMAEEQFAQSMASHGGLGLAKMVIKTMSHSENETTPPTVKALR